MLCDRCNEVIRADGVFAGYGTTANGETLCYKCCGEHDRQEMAESKAGERFVLYVEREGQRAVAVTNWPGTLRLPVIGYRWGRHNIARSRLDVWFRDHTGAWWWGVNVGDFSDVVRCRKLAAAPRGWGAV